MWMLRNLKPFLFLTLSTYSAFHYVDTHRIISCPQGCVTACLFSATARGMQTVNSCPTFGDIFLNYFSPPSSLLFLNYCPDRDREARCAVVHRVVKSRTQLSGWTELSSKQSTSGVSLSLLATTACLCPLIWRRLISSSPRVSHVLSHF